MHHVWNGLAGLRPCQRTKLALDVTQAPEPNRCLGAISVRSPASRSRALFPAKQGNPTRRFSDFFDVDQGPTYAKPASYF